MFKIINFRKITRIIFIIYILFLIYVLFLKTEYRLNTNIKFLSDEHLSYCLNLKPFSTIRRYIKAYINNNISLKIFLENIFGNFILFMPFAIFINYRYPKINILEFSIFLIIIIILIEFLQFVFIVGIADIDDMILNFTGAFIIFCINRLKNRLKYKNLSDIILISNF